MKVIMRLISLLMVVAMVSCGGGNSTSKSVEGIWKLVKLEKEGEGEIPLTECTKTASWNFSSVADEALGDGTETMKLEVKANDGCTTESFDSKWATTENGLFIASTRFTVDNETKNMSFAGLFQIVEQSDNKLIVKSMKNTMTFIK